MNGGSRTTAISQACSVPTSNPTTSVPRIASTITPVPSGVAFSIACGLSSTMNVAQIVPLKAIIDPADKSMPPEMITTAAPSEKIPNIEVSRAMLVKFVPGSFRYECCVSSSVVRATTATIAITSASSWNRIGKRRRRPDFVDVMIR